MKRGFLLAVLSLFIVITFGGFGVPEKGHATIPTTPTVEDKNINLDAGLQLFTDEGDYIESGAIFDSSYLNGIPNLTAAITTAKLAKIILAVGKNNAVLLLSGINNNAKDSFKKTYNNKADGYDTGNANAYIQGITDSVDYIRSEMSKPYLAENSTDDTSTSNMKIIYKSVLNSFINVLIKEKDQEARITQLVNQGYTNEEAIQISEQELTNAKANAKTSANSAQKDVNDASTGCSIFGISSITSCIDAGVSWFINKTLFKIGGWFLAMGGSLLDWSISSGIRDFSKLVPNGITGLWKLVRDVLYLCIVFIGFYLAFMYIIGKDEKFKKFIPWLIIFALFVNFSLPITKAMIDMSNIVALNIYNSAVPATDRAGGAGTAIMNKIGLSSLLMDQSKLQPTIAVSLLSVIFVFFASWVFFQIAILMMMRTVVLTLCIIGSPFLLIDAMVTIPAFGEKVKKIRSAFFNQLFLADVFMIMFFITLQVMEVLKPKGAITSAALATTGANVGLIFGIFMMLILLHYMLKITKSMSGEVGSLATGFVNSGVGLMAGGAMGATAMAGRASIGRLAAKARDSSWVKNNQDSFIGRKAYDFSHSVASSSMDGRNSGIAQKFSSKTGMTLGKASSTSYQQNLDNTIKDRTERQARIVTTNKDGSTNQAGVEARERFQQRAGGVIGRTGNEKEKIREALEKTNKQKEREQEAATIQKYSELKDENEKRVFFSKQEASIQAKLKEIDETNEDKIVALYAKEKDVAKRVAMFASNTSAIQQKMQESDTQKTAKDNKEAADAKYKQDTLAASVASAKAQEDLLKLMLSMNQQSQNNGTTVNANNPPSSPQPATGTSNP